MVLLDRPAERSFPDLLQEQGGDKLPYKSVDVAVALSKQNRQQRTFAALAHDTASLEQMAAVLRKRASEASNSSKHSLVEEVQLYAVTMEQLTSQVSAHSPALAKVPSHSCRKSWIYCTLLNLPGSPCA